MQQPRPPPMEALLPGDRVLGRYRSDQYRATVLSIEAAGDTVVIEWAPPHNKWGPATVARRDVQFVARPKPEHPLSALLPNRMENGDGTLTELDVAYDSCDAVGIYFAGGETRAECTARVVRFREALAARGRRLGLALVEFDPLAAAVCRHRAKLPRECLSVPPANVGLVVAHYGLMESCRIRELPSLCVVDLQGRVLTTDGLDAMDEDPEGFPWDGFKSQKTLRLEFKTKCINGLTVLAGALLAGVGAYRVGGWIVSLLGSGAPREAAL